MKNVFIKFLLLLLVSTCCIFLLAGCKQEEVKEYNVAVGLPEGVTVKGDNPVSVKHGESAVFLIVIPEGYVFKSCDGAIFDQDTGVLTVENVTSRMYLDFKIEKFSYNTNEKFAYQFNGSSNKDSSSVPNGRIASGTLITLKAMDTTRAFVGWTIGKTYANGGTVYSTNREISIRLSPETVVDGALIIYSNYVEADTIIYHANGGQINTSTDNMLHSVFYKSVKNGDSVELTYGADYLSFMECASSFYDDGTFSREG